VPGSIALFATVITLQAGALASLALRIGAPVKPTAADTADTL